jgi:putative flippase GtrA
MSHLSFRQYQRYFVVGSVIGVFALALREAIAWTLPADTPVYYSVSIIAVYAVAVVLSYAAQRSITFAHKGGWSLAQLGAFTATALIGGVVTWLVALLVRYTLRLDQLLGPLSATLAFAVGAVTASVVTYLLQARFIFPARARRTMNKR